MRIGCGGRTLPVVRTFTWNFSGVEADGAGEVVSEGGGIYGTKLLIG